MWLVWFLDYKKQSIERLGKISSPKIENRMVNKLVWLCYNKWITNTEKIIDLSYQNAIRNNQDRSFEQIIITLCTIAGLLYTSPSRKKPLTPSTQFLKLQVKDYWINRDSVNIEHKYLLSPFQASVGLQYMLTMEELIKKIKV